jgi:hypothetical protein
MKEFIVLIRRIIIRSKGGERLLTGTNRPAGCAFSGPCGGVGWGRDGHALFGGFGRHANGRQ